MLQVFSFALQKFRIWEILNHASVGSKPWPHLLRHFKLKPLLVELSGAPGHKTTKVIDPPGPVMVTAKKLTNNNNNKKHATVLYF